MQSNLICRIACLWFVEGLVSLQLGLRPAMSKKHNTRANSVLKYLRWRNTDAKGDIAAGYLGEVFDQDPTSFLPNIPLWVPAAHGQGGHWSLDEVYDWSWREWLASLTFFN